MELERAGGGELAQLVTDHRLGDVDGHVLATVVDGDGVADHLRDDRRSARPRLDDALLTLLVERVDLLEQMVVDERALLETARHDWWSPLPARAAGAATVDDELLRRLGLVTGTAFGLAPGRHGMPATRGLALATTVGMVDRVHGDTTGLGADALP